MATYEDASVGTGKKIMVVYILSGKDASKYLTPASMVVNNGVITAAPSTIDFTTAGPIDKTFGDTAFTNTVTGGTGSGKITYSSSDAEVASVDDSGLVTIKSVGTTVITVKKAATETHSEVTKAYTVNVAKAQSTIELDSPDTIAKTFGDVAFRNAITGGIGSGKITYSSSDTGVASVDDSGLVTIKSGGTTVITIKKDATETHTEVTKAYTVNVAKAPSTIIFDSPGSVSKTLGDAPFRNTFTGEGTGSIIYLSSNGTVSIDSSGLITINSTGYVLITVIKTATATHSEVSAGYIVVVN